MSTRIVAFDLSLTCAGWADGANCGLLVPPAKSDRGVARLQWLRAEVLERARGAVLVVVEGYSFASRGRAIVSLGELGGVIRTALTDAGLTWVEIPPTSRALFATGKGNAGKSEVLAAAIRKLGYTGHSYDEADALWLHRMAICRDLTDPSLTAAQRKACAGVEWPST